MRTGLVIDAVENYRRSIPKRVTSVSYTPVMRGSRVIATRVSYTLDGLPITKDIPKYEQTRRQRRPA